MPRLRRQDFLSDEDFQDWLSRDNEDLDESRHHTKAWWVKKHRHKHKRNKHNRKTDDFEYE